MTNLFDVLKTQMEGKYSQIIRSHIIVTINTNKEEIDTSCLE